MLNNLNFNEHFNFFKNKIVKNENFALARYADGEKIVLDAKNVPSTATIDKWAYNNNYIFTKDLKQSCNHKEENYFFGISCNCCDPNGSNFYKQLLSGSQLTYSNIFVNSNYDKFIEMIENLDREVIIIANSACLKANYPFPIIKKLPIEDNCIIWYEKNKEFITEAIKKIANNYNNTLFFFGAGPLSEILIDVAYKSNPNNTYIDIGSSLDKYTHSGKITRPYQEKNSCDNLKVCSL